MKQEIAQLHFFFITLSKSLQNIVFTIERFSNKCRKTKTQKNTLAIYNVQTKTVQRANQKSIRIHVASAERGKMLASNAPLGLVLFFIG